MAAVAVGGLADAGGGEGIDPKYRLFKDLKVPRKSNFKVRCESERLSEGQALLSPDALGLMRWLALGFDVEVHNGWLIGWAHLYDLVTDEPVVWDWLEEAASGLIDLATVWSGVPGRNWPRYTATRGKRPEGLVPMRRIGAPKRSRL